MSFIKDKLKEWGLLKTKEDYEFFNEITLMFFAKKLQLFGREFIADYKIILNLTTPDEVKKYIESLNDRKRKILVADTYFSMVRGTMGTQLT